MTSQRGSDLAFLILRTFHVSEGGRICKDRVIAAKSGRPSDGFNTTPFPPFHVLTSRNKRSAVDTTA